MLIWLLRCLFTNRRSSSPVAVVVICECRSRPATVDKGVPDSPLQSRTCGEILSHILGFLEFLCLPPSGIGVWICCNGRIPRFWKPTDSSTLGLPEIDAHCLAYTPGCQVTAFSPDLAEARGFECSPLKYPRIALPALRSFRLRCWQL